MSLVGIDIGSSGIRGVAFNCHGEEMAEAGSVYNKHITSSKYVEVNPFDVWDTFANVMRILASKLKKVDPVEAIAISSHGETFFMMDKDNKPVCNGIMNSDNRATNESEMLEQKVGSERIYNISGAPPHAMFALAKMAWVKNHQPDIFAKTKKIHCVGDYLLSCMKLNAAIDYSLASRTQLFDIESSDWSDELCVAAGIDKQILPPLCAAGTVISELDTDIANNLGLPSGVKIVSGGHDQACASLGLGVMEPGIIGDSAGTYECLTICSSKPNLGQIARKARLNSYCHVIPERYITLAFFPSGIMIDWFMRNICEIAECNLPAYHNELEQQAAHIASNVAVTPYLVGACNPHWDATATASISGITLSTGRAAIYRGILEGIANEFAVNLEIIQELCGKIESVRISGGGAKSNLGLKLRENKSGTKIVISATSQSSCLGAAMLAGIGAGHFKTFDESCTGMVH